MGHQGLKRYFFNTSWLFATQGIRMLAGFFVGLWVARYLGPTDFGIYNYVISFIAIFSAFASFGTNEQLVTDLVRRPEETTRILNAAFYLRILLSVLSGVAIYVITLLNPRDDSSNLYIYLSIPVILFQTFDLIDVYYRATVNAKTSSMIRIIQILVSSALKIYFIQTKAPLIYFFYIFSFDYASYGLLIYYSYRRLHEGFIFQMPYVSEIKRIVQVCWPLMFMVVSSNLLSKLDQVLIGNFLDKTELGYYSASSRIIELIGTLPTLTFASLYTAILNAKKHDENEYNRRLTHLSRFLRWISLGGAIVLSFFSLEIITLLFGQSYAPAADILKIQSFNFIFYTMSIVSIHWYIAEGLNKLLMIKTILASITNILLNLWLIPRLGINGAVYTSLITYFVFYCLYDFINPRTRACFYVNSDLARLILKK